MLKISQRELGLCGTCDYKSDKSCMIVNYDSRVVMNRKLQICYRRVFLILAAG